MSRGYVEEFFTIVGFILLLPFMPLIDLFRCKRSRNKGGKVEKDILHASKFIWDTTIPAIFSALLGVIVFWWSYQVDTYTNQNGSYKNSVLFVVNFIQGILDFCCRSCSPLPSRKTEQDSASSETCAPRSNCSTGKPTRWEENSTTKHAHT